MSKPISKAGAHAKIPHKPQPVRSTKSGAKPSKTQGGAAKELKDIREKLSDFSGELDEVGGDLGAVSEKLGVMAASLGKMAAQVNDLVEAQKEQEPHAEKKRGVEEEREAEAQKALAAMEENRRKDFLSSTIPPSYEFPGTFAQTERMLTQFEMAPAGQNTRRQETGSFMMSLAKELRQMKGEGGPEAEQLAFRLVRHNLGPDASPASFIASSLPLYTMLLPSNSKAGQGLAATGLESMAVGFFGAQGARSGSTDKAGPPKMPDPKYATRELTDIEQMAVLNRCGNFDFGAERMQLSNKETKWVLEVAKSVAAGNNSMSPSFGGKPNFSRDLAIAIHNIVAEKKMVSENLYKFMSYLSAEYGLKVTVPLSQCTKIDLSDDPSEQSMFATKDSSYSRSSMDSSAMSGYATSIQSFAGAAATDPQELTRRRLQEKRDDDLRDRDALKRVH